MPIKQAAFKALRQSKRRAEHNSKIESDIKALIRKVRKAIAANDKTKALDFLKQVTKKIDKASQRGVLKKNNAARKKSRLSTAVNKIAKA